MSESVLQIDVNLPGIRKCHFCDELKEEKDRIDYDETNETYVLYNINYFKMHPNSTRTRNIHLKMRDKTIICCKECYYKQIDNDLNPEIK